jgi:hypothetical protein
MPMREETQFLVVAALGTGNLEDPLVRALVFGFELCRGPDRRPLHDDHRAVEKCLGPLLGEGDGLGPAVHLRAQDDLAGTAAESLRGPLAAAPGPGQVDEALLQVDVPDLGERGQDGVLGHFLLVGFERDLGPLTHLDDAAGVGNAGGESNEDRQVEFLGDGERPHRVVTALLAVRRAEDRHLGHETVEAVVLFVLGRVQARVISGYDDESAERADVGGREERVGGHVQADVLHRCESASPGYRGAERDFERHLLIGGPLGVDFLVG